MPPYEYSREHGAYVRQCNCCKEVVVGTDNHDKSLELFSKRFGPRSRSSDGFAHECRACNNSSRRKLGATKEYIAALFLSQGGMCAICNKTISIEFGAPNTIRANVDHDTNTSTIRGLLCEDCNKGIGLLKHSARSLQAAINYLNSSTPKKLEVG